MLSALFALSMLTSTASADWKLHGGYGLTGSTYGENVGLELNSAVAASPFLKGPQLELSQSLELARDGDMHRIGLGLRQELTPNLAVSGRGILVMPTYGTNRSAGLPGVETAVSYIFVQNQGMGFGLHVYNGAAMSMGETRWWTGAGLQMTFGGTFTRREPVRRRG